MIGNSIPTPFLKGKRPTLFSIPGVLPGENRNIQRSSGKRAGSRDNAEEIILFLDKYICMYSTPSPVGRSYGLLIFSISLAIFMSSLDGTIVNIALPTISEAFGISSSTVSWVATAYMLAMAGCILVFGKVSDMIGFRSVFLSGFAIFTAGSFFCGVLPDLFHSFPLLVGSRVFQAIGGAMITAIAPAMVAVFIPDERKGGAMGTVMTLAALGTALGPSVGGVLTEYLSWNWIFFINVPVGIFAVLLGARVIPGSATQAGMKRFDKKGAALVFCGLASLIFPSPKVRHWDGCLPRSWHPPHSPVPHSSSSSGRS